jgi:hypothetical protein
MRLIRFFGFSGLLKAIEIGKHVWAGLLTPTSSHLRRKVSFCQRSHATAVRCTNLWIEALTRKGFVVVAAASVPEALKHIADEVFDVIITDLHMPEAGDGFTIVSAMRHSQSRPNAG